MSCKQFLLTPSMGKRLIGRGIASHPAVATAIQNGTLVIVAGTTNGYVAEEVLRAFCPEQSGDFARKGFRRGMVTPPDFDAESVKAELVGDVVVSGGRWRQGQTIFDVADSLSAGDVILKGANVVNVEADEAAVYIGHPQAGTAGAAVRAVTGRRVQMIVPVGLEKRTSDAIMDIAAQCNAPDTEGPGMLPLPGRTYTELDAIEMLTGASGRLLAAGGVYGAEGAVWIGVRGTDEQLAATEQLWETLRSEPPCRA